MSPLIQASVDVRLARALALLGVPGVAKFSHLTDYGAGPRFHSALLRSPLRLSPIGGALRRGAHSTDRSSAGRSGALLIARRPFLRVVSRRSGGGSPHTPTRALKLRSVLSRSLDTCICDIPISWPISR